MAKVFCIAHNIISPLATTSQLNYDAVMQGETGIVLWQNGDTSPAWLSKTDRTAVAEIPDYTFFENIAIQSVQKALENCSIHAAGKETIFILSTTKGNIDAIHQGSDAVNLFSAAQKIANYFDNAASPIVVNQACISGISAIGLGFYLLQTKQYQNAIVVGADVLSDFVVSGFEALGAASHDSCRPFDKNRKGINLGEAAATLILSTTAGDYELKSVTTTNDANHISGPSRTGEELAHCLTACIAESGLQKSDIGFVCLHGTGTLFNDEMESKAMQLAGLSSLPAFSLKANFGHTLGASGVLETIIGMMVLGNETIPASLGYTESGVSQPLRITTDKTKTTGKAFIKSAAGFGGCNGSLIFSKA